MDKTAILQIKRNIKLIVKPQQSINQILRSAKDKAKLGNQEVYSLYCVTSQKTYRRSMNRRSLLIAEDQKL